MKSGYVHNEKGLGFPLLPVSVAIPETLDEMDVVEVDGKMEWDEFFNKFVLPKDSTASQIGFALGLGLKAAGLVWIANRFN